MSKLGPYDYNTINTGDAVEFLRTLPDDSVPMFLFSPPYNLGTTSGGVFAKLHYSENAKMTARGGGGKWNGGDLDTVQQALCHAHELLAVTLALQAEAVVKLRRRVRSEYWRGWFERARWKP